MYPNNLNFPYNIGTRIPFTNIQRIPISSGIPMINNRIGLFSRLSNSLGAFRNINWSNIINNTSKTLNVINQAIPIVKQTGPMIHNMRSMLKVASVFRDETSNKKRNIKQENYNNITEQKEKEESKDNSSLPNFFI